MKTRSCSKCRKAADSWSSGTVCRDCKNAATKAHRERRKSEGRPYHATAKRLRTPRQKAAHRMVSTAINQGVLIPSAMCCKCNSGPGSFPRLGAHHHDYLKPLEVLWLCRTCHIRIHDQPNACINAEGPADRDLYALPRRIFAGFDKARNQWIARTYKGNKTKYLGRFKTQAEAQAAIDADMNYQHNAASIAA